MEQKDRSVIFDGPVFFISPMMKKTLLLPLVALFLVTACRQPELPEGIMTESQMVDFLQEAYLLEGFYAIETQYRYEALTTDALRRYDSLLDAQGLTRDDVERSFDYYSSHPDLFQVIQDTVVARLEEW